MEMAAACGRWGACRSVKQEKETEVAYGKATRDSAQACSRYSRHAGVLRRSVVLHETSQIRTEIRSNETHLS